MDLLESIKMARFVPTAVMFLVYVTSYSFMGYEEYREIMVLRTNKRTPNNHAPPPPSTPPTSNLDPTVLRRYALDGLERIRVDKELDTVVSNRNNVLERCFPLNWEPGTLQEAFQRRMKEQRRKPIGDELSDNKQNNVVKAEEETTDDDDKFRIVLVGGSASAWAPQNCQVGSNPLWGLYSNMLERALNNQDDYGQRRIRRNNNDGMMMQFEVVNRAQGDTDSAQNAVLLDRYIDPISTDLIIHEFGINLHPQGKDMHVHALNLWLASVHSMYEEVNRKVPPLIIMHFWRDSQALYPEEMREHGLDDTVLRNQWEIIDYYRKALGWEIQVINVAPGINGTLVANNTHLAFDDGHHQGCTVSRLISSMIQQAIFSNLATTITTMGDHEATTEEASSESPKKQEVARSADQSKDVPLPNFQQWCKKREVFDPFYCVFFNRPSQGARHGSLSPWTPNTGKSGLNFLSNTTASYKMMDHKITNPYPAMGNRPDRKFGYELSSCQKNNSDPSSSVLQFTLMEPDLKWIAFACSNIYGTGNFRLQINGVDIEFTGFVPLPPPYNPMGRLRAILKIPDIVPRAPYYTMSFCSRDDLPVGIEDEKKIWLFYLTAIVQETEKQIVIFN